MTAKQHATMELRRRYQSFRRYVGEFGRVLDWPLVSVGLLLLVSLCNAAAFLGIKTDWANILHLQAVATWVKTDWRHLASVLVVGPGVTLLRKILNVIAIQDDKKIAAVYRQSIEGLKQCSAKVVKHYQGSGAGTITLQENTRRVADLMTASIVINFAQIAGLDVSSLKVITGRVENGTLIDIGCVGPDGSPPSPPLKALQDPDTCFSRAIQQKTTIVIPDIAFEVAEKGQASRFKVIDADPHGSVGSLICHPVLDNMDGSGNVIYVLSIRSKEPYCFTENNVGFYESLLQGYSYHLVTARSLEEKGARSGQLTT